MNEKIKEAMAMQRQFQDLLMKEQEARARQTQTQLEKYNKLQEGVRIEMDKVVGNVGKDIQAMEGKVNKAREEKANEQREAAKLLAAKN